MTRHTERFLSIACSADEGREHAVQIKGAKRREYELYIHYQRKY